MAILSKKIRAIRTRGLYLFTLFRKAMYSAGAFLLQATTRFLKSGSVFDLRKYYTFVL